MPAYVQFTGDTPSISGRADRIMYMSPSFKGFSVGGSHGYHFRGDIWDVTAKFSGKFSGWGTVANIAFGRNHTREFDTGFIGVNGVGVKFDNISLGLGALAPFSITGKEGTGISFTFGFADRNYKQVRHKNGRSQTYALSYLDMFTDMGMTIFSVYTGEQRNMTLAPNPQNTLKSRYWMVGVQQNIDKVGTEVYAGYYRTNLKIKNSVFKFYAQDAVLVGARVKF